MEKITKNGWVAMNKGEFNDLENISFYNTKRDAKRAFGDSQQIVKVSVTFNIEQSEPTPDSENWLSCHPSELLELPDEYTFDWAGRILKRKYNSMGVEIPPNMRPPKGLRGMWSPTYDSSKDPHYGTAVVTETHKSIKGGHVCTVLYGGAFVGIVHFAADGFWTLCEVGKQFTTEHPTFNFLTLRPL